ncbi:MAG TPA: flagellar motor protein MotB [Magnetospirillum sp.]|nr:flagellar motor protein MotB [Magnetospirillum sp.]
MRRDRFHTKNEEPLEDWLLSYADMITLIMAFFVMLAAISKVDANLYEKVQSGMAKDIGNREAARPLETVRKELAQVIATTRGGEDAVDVGSDERGVVLNMDADAMFKPGSAEIRPEIMPVVKGIAETLNNDRFATYRIEVQGHTDDTPVNTPQFPSNFELAAARALSAMRTMNKLGLPEQRMTITSFGQYSPRVPNHREDGTPLPVNQALNRRISIHVFPH